MKVIEQLELSWHVDITNVYGIKPIKLLELVQAAYESAMSDRIPFTVATLCVKTGMDRQRLAEVLNKKWYEWAKSRTQNLLLIYAENNLFTGKNVAWAIFYLKNVFPELYKDKNETDINIKSISLVKLATKAEELKRKRLSKVVKEDREVVSAEAETE